MVKIGIRAAIASVFAFIISTAGITVNAQSTKTVSGTIGVGSVDITLTAEDAADTILIDLFSDDNYFAEQFVGYNFVYPGLYRHGNFTIHNHTGEAYTVTDYSFQVDTASIQRTHNEASISNKLTKEQLASLSGDDWYKMNADYFGEQNFDDINTLRKMFMSAPELSGMIAGRETSPEMIALAQKYLYQQCQFSFNVETHPIESRSLSGAALTLWDYINKTEANQDIVLGEMFPDEIGVDGFSSTIAYTNDYNYIGNAYNGSYIDFKFTLTLKRPATETEPVETTSSEESANPEETAKSEEPTNSEEPANPIPETGDNAYLLWASVLYISAIALTVLFYSAFKKAKR